MYVFDQQGSGVYLWDNEMQTVLWTSESNYPYLYAFQTGNGCTMTREAQILIGSMSCPQEYGRATNRLTPSSRHFNLNGLHDV